MHLHSIFDGSVGVGVAGVNYGVEHVETVNPVGESPLQECNHMLLLLFSC